jgi:hypothetical protein
MPVTIISSALCQREMVRSVASFRVISMEPNVIAIIMAQVVTMVPLSFTKPCCQKICWSEVICTLGMIIVRLLAGYGSSSERERMSRVTAMRASKKPARQATSFRQSP